MKAHKALRPAKVGAPSAFWRCPLTPIVAPSAAMEGVPERMALLGEEPDRGAVLVIWVLYNRLTAEHPGLYVLRRQWANAGEIVIDLAALTDPEIEPLRAKVPPGLVCMPRQEGDDFTIVESWF